MRNTNKKGFTIVELVIVVAVIAILAAVLIPTFSGIIRKANVSKDNQLIAHLNTALAADVDGDKTMAGAIAAAEEFGYDIGKINAKANGNEILWDSVANVFCYLNDGVVEYVSEVDNKGTGAQLWIIKSTIDTVYSTYLINNTDATVKAVHSLDVSACHATNVIYEGTGTVDIFTDGGDLIVNKGTVNHYGIGNLLTVATGATCNQHGIFAADQDDFTNAGAENDAYQYADSASKLAELLAAKAPKIALNKDIVIDADPSVGFDFTVIADVELNLNGYDIISVHNNSVGSATANNGVFYVNAEAKFTLTGAGNITFKTNAQMGWNNCTAVIAGRGDIVIDGAIKVANLGGTDMSYAIDVYSWGDAESVSVTIKAGTVYSADYCAIRLNKQSPAPGDKTVTFNLVIDGGVVKSENKAAIFAHDGSEAADGIYNITINGGVVASGANKPLVSTWGWDTETVNVTENK